MEVFSYIPVKTLDPVYLVPCSSSRFKFKFPKGKSIADVIRSRFGEAFDWKIRKFEKNYNKSRKGHLDYGFYWNVRKIILFKSFYNLN